jgi:hypothetical protein
MQYPTIAQPQYAFAPTFAEGGLTRAAQQVQASGRNGDSMLIHMTPGEVGGLQALAMAGGGSLTINPTTGLPEANFLKRILPTVLGIGASMLFPAAAPWMIGAGVGGIETLRTGDLGKGLMAGLGAFGGAGLGSALASAGAAAPGAMASNLGVQGAATGAGSQASMLAAQNAGFGQAGLEATRQAAATAAGANMAPALSTAQLAGQGVSNLGSMQGLSNLSTGLQTAFPSTTARVAAATPTVSELAYQFSPKPPEMPKPEESEYKGPYTPTPRQVRFPTEEELRSTREFSFFSPSNPIPFQEGGAVEDRAVRAPVNPSMAGMSPEFDYNFRPVQVQGMPALGVAAAPATIGGKGGLIQRVMQQVRDQQQGKPGDLSGYDYDPMTQQMVKMKDGGSVPTLEDGGFVLTKKAVDGIGGGSNKKGQKVASKGLGALPIKGKGTGTSDSIKTSIDGKIPARVSNGEAYIPKRNVKKAGGANKLYALMRNAERRA